MKVKIGDKIRHYLFGGEVLTGKVEDIQICREGDDGTYAWEDLTTEVTNEFVEQVAD
jgi:hypothetical protein